MNRLKEFLLCAVLFIPCLIVLAWDVFTFKDVDNEPYSPLTRSKEEDSTDRS